MSAECDLPEMMLRFKLRCFPICISLYFFTGSRFLHSRPTSPLLFIPSLLCVSPSRFHFGEEGIHTEELEADLGESFVFLNEVCDG